MNINDMERMISLTDDKFISEMFSDKAKIKRSRPALKIAVCAAAMAAAVIGIFAAVNIPRSENASEIIFCPAITVTEQTAAAVTEHQKIIFNGNGYSDEWIAEAEKRGLPNIRTMVEAIPYLVSDKTVTLFERQNVLTKAELESRAEINYEIYSKTINIEAKTMIDMAGKQYIPAVIRYVTSLADSINSITTACPNADTSVQNELLEKCSSLLAETQKALANLEKVTDEVTEKEEGKEEALFFKDVVFPAMNALRAPIDELEMIVDQAFWPVPTYGDLLFEV